MQTHYPNASRIKRLLALMYDSLLVVAILFLATFIALLLNHGESFGPNHLGFLSYLLVSAGLYYIWSWMRGGQTLGMLAWQLKLVTTGGDSFTKKQLLIRYLVGVIGFWCAGLSYLWCLWDKEGQTLADRLAKTKMISIKP